VTFIEIYLAGLGVIIGMMTLIWLISLAIRDSSIVDIFWGAGFVIAATAYFIMTDGNETRSVITLILVALWGLRLTAHIGYRNIGKGEDFRYQKWREQYGAAYWRVSYLRVYVLQGVIMWIVSAPLLQAQFHGSPDAPSILDILGIIVWGVGFFFEAVGDWQLTRFKGDPANKGKVMNTGLWRYTRHPNYFGDAMAWWGFFLLALSTEGGFLTIFSPLIMTFLLVRVSGVAMLEKSLKDKKPEYVDYIKRTSAFIPRPPQK
jgi:steroid 5-alpha reductase family enzyme